METPEDGGSVTLRIAAAGKPESGRSHLSDRTQGPAGAVEDPDFRSGCDSVS